MSKPPSQLLEESADPFDLACTKVKALENASANVLVGRNYQALLKSEQELLSVLRGIDIVFVDGQGVIKRRTK